LRRSLLAAPLFALGRTSEGTDEDDGHRPLPALPACGRARQDQNSQNRAEFKFQRFQEILPAIYCKQNGQVVSIFHNLRFVDLP